MEVKATQLQEVIVDVLCDVCDQATTLEFGTLKARWGDRSKHNGEHYEVQLCESCFFLYAYGTQNSQAGSPYV